MTFPIFVVQDDDDSREAMCTLLADEGFLLKPPSLDEVLELAARYCDRGKG